MTLHRMSAGTGYEYLLRHVARGDVDAPAQAHGPDRLTSYYADSGYPPGRWMGAGLADLSGLRAGDVVTEEQLARLMGEGCDPTSGVPLGRRHAAPGPGPPSVAGFDLTFSPAKSVSALWAIAPPAVRERVWDAHRVALAQSVAWMEAEVIFTRVGHGGVAQRDVRGVVAAAFDHWDTRSGDPQPHTHLVVANRVRGVDARWRTLDSSTLHRAAVAVSELYDAYLQDELTRTLGLDWQAVARTTGPRGRETVGWEAVGVPAALVDEFSTRSEQIHANLEALVEEWRATQSREPSAREWVGLRQRATLMDRPTKDRPEPLDTLHRRWRGRAAGVLGAQSPQDVVADTVHRFRGQLLWAGDLSEDIIRAFGTTVMQVTSTRRATWTRWNLLAEAARLSKGLRFASSAERDGFHERVADAAERASIALRPPPLVEMPQLWQRRSGRSIFEGQHTTRFTSHAILGAEDLLLASARQHGAATCQLDETAVEQAAASLGNEQLDAVRRIASSGRSVDVLIGPAGAGKTLTLSALRRLWEDQLGPDRVVGLASSAAAAEVLGESLEIPAENTAKWLHEAVGGGRLARRRASRRLQDAIDRTSRDRPDVISRLRRQLAAVAHEEQKWTLAAGSLLIVDEASLAGTLPLAAIVDHARQSGAKVLLVGDPFQLGAVEAGGALRLLAADVGAVELTEVHRFVHRWERRASLRLRHGRLSALDAYEQHGRIHSGDAAGALEDAFQAWLEDANHGRASLLIAADNDTVTALNQRSRQERIALGEVEAAGVELADGTCAGRGDRIVTRSNDRSLAAGQRWVRNGDTWEVRHRSDDGGLRVRLLDGGHELTLPTAYVAANVQLAYASTAHRAQGATVDAAHVVVTTALSRETLYVGMTRGRLENHAYVAVPDTDEHGHVLRPSDGRSVLEAVLARSDADLSATETLRSEFDARESLRWLVPVYEEMARSLAEHRLRTVLSPALHAIRTAPRDAAERLACSPGWPALVASVRSSSVAESELRSALVEQDWSSADPAADVAHRLTNRNGATEHRLAGSVVSHPPTGDHAVDQALDEVALAITARAGRLADRALAEGHPWTLRLGPAGKEGGTRRYDVALSVAAYRDRWAVTGPDPLGPPPRDPRQAAHRHRTLLALRALRSSPDVRTVTADPVPIAQRSGPTQ